MRSKKTMRLSTTLKQISVAFFVIAISVGCAGGGGGSGGSSDANKAIKSAEAAMAKASKNKWIWRDTGKILKKAKAANKKGDGAKAIKLAKKAQSQAEIAVSQYFLEKSQDRSKYMTR